MAFMLLGHISSLCTLQYDLVFLCFFCHFILFMSTKICSSYIILIYHRHILVQLLYTFTLMTSSKQRNATMIAHSMHTFWQYAVVAWCSINMMVLVLPSRFFWFPDNVMMMVVAAIVLVSALLNDEIKIKVVAVWNHLHLASSISDMT